MPGKILITDSLFIFDEHVKKLEDAGYEVERLDKPEATEEELCQAIKGKVGYILGGVEKVTDKVIESADELKAIAFTGADYAGFIPSHELATKKGIAIANAPGANSGAVAEYTLTLMLIMLRGILDLTQIGDKNFMTTNSVSDVQIGIVGMGRIAERIVRMLGALDAKNIVYWNRTRKPELEEELGIKYVELHDLFKTSDLISNHLSTQAGQVIAADLVKATKDAVIFINTGSDATYDVAALYEKLANSDARAAFDAEVHDDRFKELPTQKWLQSNGGTAFNTHAANQKASDIAVESLLNMLAGKKDQHQVN